MDPQHVPEEFDVLPDEPGVYWFMDAAESPYIGMSIHIQKRVLFLRHHRVPRPNPDARHAQPEA